MFSTIIDNPVLRIASLIGLFLAVAAATYGLASLFGRRSFVRERLAPDNDGSATLGNSGSLRNDRVESAWVKLVDTIENSGLSLLDTKDESLRLKLTKAGFRQPYAPRVYTLVRLGLVIGLPLLMLLMLWAQGSSPSLLKLYLLLGGAGLFGLYVPSLFIRAKADRRQQEIINAFPDALDLMLVCVEAGLGLEAAFARVGSEITRTHPLLAEQYGAVVLELRAGRSREDALRRMADRAGVDEIRAFATLLIQSTKLGSSIAQTLRIYSSEMREKRRMRAEEKAHRLPVLLSIPLVTCMLPVMIGVLILPAVIRTIRTLLPALAGGAGG